MGITATPYCIEALSHNAEIFREAAQSFIIGTGVVGAADLAVTQNGSPNMSVNVATGQVWIPGTLSSTSGFGTNVNGQTAYGLPSTLNEQGSYYAWNNATVNLAIATSDPTNPRIDIVCASVQDAAYSGSNNQALLQVITGTPAASPVAPSAPASSVVVCQIAVGNGATSILTANITDKRPFLALQAPENPYRAEMYRNAAYTQAATGATVFPYDTVVYDPNGNCTTGASAAYTVPVAGVYDVSAVAQATANTITSMRLNRNASQVRQVGNGTAAISVNMNTTYLCAAGDTLQIVTAVSATSTVFSVNQIVAAVSFTLMIATA